MVGAWFRADAMPVAFSVWLRQPWTTALWVSAILAVRTVTIRTTVEVFVRFVGVYGILPVTWLVVHCAVVAIPAAVVSISLVLIVPMRSVLWLFVFPI